ncbi:hypothetical protein UO65_4336 [Actinokineospora spheciospongiae]|uniref:SD-repeat containing protein B domain-containing protein n=1 Tax=Actinokineospora spheciospongiae TaxID=909613 RepID=W7IVF0_9PSEU|nr:carboxypeptidase regulatory-like domain-containing protein [Actinokineospora spheciospongiae]EWC60381.1 hypothetical protein UO65_4336 [Actinokineospora spheciospongiae]
MIGATAFVSAVITGGALLGAVPAAAADTGGISGLVWFDRDASGTLGFGDAPAPMSGIRVDNLSTGESTQVYAGSDGTYQVPALAPGRYRVAVGSGWTYERTTPGHVDVRVRPGRTATADFGLRGGEVCGTAWDDADGDGMRESGEFVLPAVQVTVNTPMLVQAVTDASGRYCAHDLPLGGEAVVQPQYLAQRGFGFTRGIVESFPGEPFDSKIDPVTGNSHRYALTTEALTVDVGYLKATSDLSTSQIIFEGQPAGKTTFAVGDTFTVYGSVFPSGNVPERLGATLTVPAGLRIVDRAGGMPSTVQGRSVVGEFPQRRTPGANEFIGARVVVEHAFSAADVTLTVHPGDFPDSDPANNVLTQTINAV